MEFDSFSVGAVADALKSLLTEYSHELVRFETDSYSGDLIQLVSRRRLDSNNPGRMTCEYAVIGWEYGTCSHCDHLKAMEEEQENRLMDEARDRGEDPYDDYDSYCRPPEGEAYEELEQMVHTRHDTATWRTYDETMAWLDSSDIQLQCWGPYVDIGLLKTAMRHYRVHVEPLPQEDIDKHLPEYPGSEDPGW